MTIHIESLAQFKEEIASEGKVLIDFFATWCGPCVMLTPIIEQVEREHPELKVLKVDVDENPDIAGLFNVEAIPTLLVYENGEQIKRQTSYMPKPVLEGFLGY